MTGRRYQVFPSSEAGYGPGRFIVRYWDPEIGVWFDAGDPVSTREEADAALVEWRESATGQPS